MLYSLDIETTGLDPWKDRPLVIGVYNPSKSYRAFQELEGFKQWLKSEPSARFICHNGAFDVNFLHVHGVDVINQFAYDTRTIASVLCPQPPLAAGQKHVFGLENLNQVLLDGTSYKLDRTRITDYSFTELFEYNRKDCEITYNLFKRLVELIPEKNWEFVESWIMPATRFCAELNRNGVYGDWKGLEAFKKELEQIRVKALAELNEVTKEAQNHWAELQLKELVFTYNQMKIKALEKAKDPVKRSAFYDKLLEKAKTKLEGFNWNSQPQLVWLLRDYYNQDLHNKRTGKETTDDEKLKELDHPVTKKLLAYREVEKLLSQQVPAFLDNVKPDGCVHGQFKVGGTRTGRLSSSEPNLQQVSSRKPLGRKIRGFIQAKPECNLVTIDYAQIEPRLVAHYSKESELIHAFENNIDIYSVFASKIFNLELAKDFKEKHPVERACGKTGGLSVLYGTGPMKFAEMVRKETGKVIKLTQSKALVNDFRNGLPKVQEFKEQLERRFANRGLVYNLLGRPLMIEDNNDLYMLSLNTLIQSSASDLVVDSQISLVKPALEKLRIPFKYRLLVHDEVVLELPQGEAESLTREVIVPLMTNKMREHLALDIPLKVEWKVGKAWEKA